MTHDPDALALLRTILTHPDDDAPRLVYADWLEEHGEPERAAFVRAQIELAKVGPDWDTEPECGHTGFIDGKHVGGGEVVVDLIRIAPAIGSRARIRVSPKLNRCSGMRVFAVNEYYDEDERRNCFRVHLKRDEYSGKGWSRAKALRSRERELWDSCIWKSFSDSLPDVGYGKWFVRCKSETPLISTGTEAVVQRGFIEQVTCPGDQLAAVVEAVCPDLERKCEGCGGTKWRRYYTVDGDWDEGECGDCHGRGTIDRELTGQEQPVEVIRLTSDLDLRIGNARIGASGPESCKRILDTKWPRRRWSLVVEGTTIKPPAKEMHGLPTRLIGEVAEPRKRG